MSKIDIVEDYIDAFSESVDLLQYYLKMFIPTTDDSERELKKASSILDSLKYELQTADSLAEVNDIVNLEKLYETWDCDRERFSKEVHKLSNLFNSQVIDVGEEYND